jgi:hypothetical protein
MDMQITLLSDDQLNAVSGGTKNDPLTTHTKIVELGPMIAAYASARKYSGLHPPRVMSGPAMQTRLSEFGSTVPVIFLTGYPDIPTTVQAIKASAG